MFNDLQQEGVLVALKVLTYFDPTRGVKIETLLTTALRRHYRRHIRTVLNEALDYTLMQREGARAYERERGVVNLSVETRVLMARVRRLPEAQRALALDLFREGGALRKVAQSNHWSVTRTKRNVARLRATLRRGDL